jgi:hypothetical protein
LGFAAGAAAAAASVAAGAAAAAFLLAAPPAEELREAGLLLLPAPDELLRADVALRVPAALLAAPPLLLDLHPSTYKIHYS